MWACKMCEETKCLTTYICDDCRTIRHLMNLYSKKVVLGVLDKCLVIDKFKDTPRVGDESYMSAEK